MLAAFPYLDQGNKGYLTETDFFHERFVLTFKEPARKLSAAKLAATSVTQHNADSVVLSLGLPNVGMFDPLARDGVAPERLDGIENTTNVAPIKGVITFEQFTELNEEARTLFVNTVLTKTAPVCVVDEENGGCLHIVVRPGSDGDTAGSFYMGMGGVIFISEIALEYMSEVALSEDRIRTIAKGFTSPCIKEGESQEVYIARAVAGCTAFVIDNAYDSWLGRLIARSFAISRAILISVCSTEVSTQLANGQVKTCEK